jgi:hypothetical protein
MANPEFKGTVVPKTGPIVDPLPKLYEQFDPQWGHTWVRPPLQRDGTPITTEEDLKKAQDNNDFLQPPVYHCWSAAACHATCLTMLIDWLANRYPDTAGKVKIPNRADDKSTIDPLHVAYWLWKDGKLNQTKLVSDTDHPPYLPYREKDWKIDHDRICAGAQTITLTIEGKDPEPLTYKRVSLTHPTVAQAKQRLKKRDELTEEQKAAQERLDEVDKEMETADKKTKRELNKEHTTLQAKLKKINQQIEKNDAGDETDEAGVMERQRRKNKDALQEALLRGPVLMTMTVPSDHYILLVGYRGTMMYILDPGASIPNYWFGSQSDLENAPGGRIANGHSRDELAINGEFEFQGVPQRKPKRKSEKIAKIPKVNLRFIDNIKYFESFYFKSMDKDLVQARKFDKTDSLVIQAFARADCRLPGGG